MKNQTLLQKITDTLESIGIPVSGIEVWPPEEDGRVSVSLVIRPRPEPECAGLDEETAASLDRMNADKAPDDPPAARNPCGECTGPDCDTCPVKNGTPIKLYTPEEAADAMKRGRILRDEKGDLFYWAAGSDSDLGAGFYRKDKEGNVLPASNFSGLYEEAKYV
jgi:hypothetical protein